MSSQYEPVTLVTLNGGAANEMFDRELLAVLRNVADPNTKADAARKIVLTVVVEPDDNRELLAFRIETKSTLAASQPSAGVGYLVRRGADKLVAVASNARQADLFDGGEPEPDIQPIAEKERGA